VCTSGDTAIGGGMSFADDQGAHGNGWWNGYPPSISQSYPSGGGGSWTIRLASAHGTTNIDVTVYAICYHP
jgi:hypothetical protein